MKLDMEELFGVVNFLCFLFMFRGMFEILKINLERFVQSNKID